MTTYYTNCNLWTGTEKATTSNAWFGVAAGKITATGTGDAPLQPEDDLVDLNGQTVIPGLINAHVHLSMDPERNNLDHRSETEVAVNAIKAARQLLAAGVTTVRDCGCAFNVDIKLKQLGKQVGEPLPTIVPSGRPMSMTGGMVILSKASTEKATCLISSTPLTKCAKPCAQRSSSAPIISRSWRLVASCPPMIQLMTLH
ncbi:amidohydrolase family protein [Lacticaseibacillus manihotivorans]|uniref:amidohydrolase family protein n=1 Tax=Lacticaseibacillus manihotivorans TaxID=88233 RepID=UPI0024372B7D|nr:amidohydrolase family protein [Lacticaseibacillus manihotivorans]